MSEARVVLIGCDHKLQHINVKSSLKSLQEQLRRVIQEAVTTTSPVLIAEEAGRCNPTVAEDIASECGLEYRNIDIPIQFQNLVKHRPPSEIDDCAGQAVDLTETDPYSKAWNLVREYHMFETVLDTAQPERCVLMIVGGKHVKPLAVLFRSRGIAAQEFESITCG